MGYLIAHDYLKSIQDLSLAQVVSGNDYFRTSVELAAQAELASYLTQKYDLPKEFTSTLPYDPTRTYNAADRVYLDAAAYSTGAAYALGAMVLQNGKVYECSTAIVAPENFDPAHWTLLGNQFDIFFANYPYPVFNLVNGTYKKGTIVFWNNHTYTALQNTAYYSHEDLLQFYQQTAVPFTNVFPDDPVSGSKYWHDNGQYAVPAGNLLTDPPEQTIEFIQARDDWEIEEGVTPGLVLNATTFFTTAAQSDTLKGWGWGLERIGYGTMYLNVDYEKVTDPILDQFGFRLLQPGDKVQLGEKFVFHFIPIVTTTAPTAPASGLTVAQIILQYFTKGDNRNQQILMFYIDLTLYHLYSRIAPKSIPQVRTDRYNAAIKWCKMAGVGDITADLIRIQPPQGMRIRSGSQIRQVNSY